MPRHLDLGDRAKALTRLGVNPLAHATIGGTVKDVLSEADTGLLVGARHWLLAARHGTHPLPERPQPPRRAPDPLGHLPAMDDGPTKAGRLVDAPLRSLTTPPSAPVALASRVRVSAAAARSRSTAPSGANAIA